MHFPFLLDTVSFQGDIADPVLLQWRNLSSVYGMSDEEEEEGEILKQGILYLLQSVSSSSGEDFTHLTILSQEHV